MNYEEIIDALIRILDAYEGKRELLCNQGQALDGYSALANFIEVAKQARKIKETTK